jgi:hypothetical protein
MNITTNATSAASRYEWDDDLTPSQNAAVRRSLRERDTEDEPVQTNVVFVTVKIDAKRSDATREALEFIECALQSFYGGEENGWHAFETITGYDGKQQRVRSISLEAATL